MNDNPTCTCGRELITITMATPAKPVTLRSCSSCDRLEWLVGEGQVTKAAALRQLATTGRR